MADNTLGVFASVAGVAGIGLGIVLTIFKQAVHDKVLSRFPEEKAFQILRLIIVLTFLTGMMGMVVWVVEAYINKGYRTGSLSVSDHQRAMILANKGCFFYEGDELEHVFLDEDVALAQKLYILNLKETHKGVKFLIYGEPEWYAKGAEEVGRTFGRVYYLAKFLDFPLHVPIASSKFTSVSGLVGDYACTVRVVSEDYKGE